jgi:hypothetical protein
MSQLPGLCGGCPLLAEYYLALAPDLAALVDSVSSDGSCDVRFLPAIDSVGIGTSEEDSCVVEIHLTNGTELLTTVTYDHPVKCCPLSTASAASPLVLVDGGALD